MKFAMYGSGAAGSVFASYLRKGGADIILIDRYEAHMKKVAEEGMHFTIHQEEDGGYKDYDYQLKGFRTYITAADAPRRRGQGRRHHLHDQGDPARAGHPGLHACRRRHDRRRLPHQRPRQR